MLALNSGRMKRRFSNISILISAVFLAISLNTRSLAQVNGPQAYKTASQDLGEWFIIASGHQQYMSATSFAQLHSVGSGANDSAWSATMASEFGLSLTGFPIGGAVKKSFEVFNAKGDDFPEALYIPRIHYTKGITQNNILGLSYLANPNIDLSGFGANWMYSLELWPNRFLAFSLKYGESNIPGFFSAKTRSLSVAHSLSYSSWDVYAGINYIEGDVTFLPEAGDQAFDRIVYSSALGENFFAGWTGIVSNGSFVTNDKLYMTLQVDLDRNQSPTYSLRFSVKFASSVGTGSSQLVGDGS